MELAITGGTKLFALLGYPVSHSVSPIIHNSFFRVQKTNCTYIPLKTSPEALRETVRVLRESFEGFNVTIPHKQAIIEYLDEVDPRALLYGAINTVKNDNGRLVGYNTDGYGFIKAFEMSGIEIEGKKVLLVGAGGGARAAICELLRRKCHVDIINRSLDRAIALKQDVSGHFPGSVAIYGSENIEGTYDCLINTTPVGMFPNIDSMPIDPRVLERIGIVYDLIYNPWETKLLSAARHRGSKIINGFPMLFFQAAEANRIWTGLPLPNQAGQELFRKIAGHLKIVQTV